MCECEEDIIITMKRLQQYLNTTTFRIRSGGHSFGGYSKALNAVLIDLSTMKDVQMLGKANDRLSIQPGIKLARRNLIRRLAHYL